MIKNLLKKYVEPEYYQLAFVGFWVAILWSIIFAFWLDFILGVLIFITIVVIFVACAFYNDFIRDKIY